jgi:hypothetical protein
MDSNDQRRYKGKTIEAIAVATTTTAIIHRRVVIRGSRTAGAPSGWVVRVNDGSHVTVGQPT